MKEAPCPRPGQLLLRLFALLLLTGAARADEIRLLAAGAAKAAIERMAPEFTRQTGHTVHASFDTVGAQRNRVLQATAGNAADVVILSARAVDELRAASRLRADEAVDIGVVAVSLAVPTGAPVPDISTPAALKAALLAASSIAYADPARGATAGTHFDKVLNRLELHAQLQARLTVLPFGVEVIREVSKGRFALGVSQSSEILQHEGITLVGALPAPYALTTRYAAALASPQPAARQFLQFLSSPTGLSHFRATGFLAE